MDVIIILLFATSLLALYSWSKAKARKANEEIVAAQWKLIRELDAKVENLLLLIPKTDSEGSVRP